MTRGAKAASRKEASHPQMVTSTTSPAVTIHAKANAPKWFISALKMLQLGEMPRPDRWFEVVTAWKAFEEKAKYQENGYLDSAGRPACVGLWIGRHRSITWRPVLPKLSVLEKEFRCWWTSLQPDWRISEEGDLMSEELEGDWGALRKPGLNGILGALVCLFYWGLEVKVNGKKRYQSWVDHVEDCILVLGHLI
jgi:hypothetical protein